MMQVSDPRRKQKVEFLFGCMDAMSICVWTLQNTVILKQKNLSVREAFLKSMDEELSGVRSGGKFKGKVSKSREKDAIKDKKRKQDEIDRTELGFSSGEAEEVSALEIKKDESRVKAARVKKLNENARTNLQLHAPRTRSRASKDQSTKQEGAQGGPKIKRKAGPVVASNITKKKGVKEKIDGKQKLAAEGDYESKANVTEKAKVGTTKGKNSKQEDVKELNRAKSPATTMNHAAEEPNLTKSERRMRVMQSLGLIAPVGSPFRRNGTLPSAPKPATPSIPAAFLQCLAFRRLSHSSLAI